MKPEKQYTLLKELADKLSIEVREQNLRINTIKVKSGLCKVKGRYLFIMDKHKNIRDKIHILAECLASFPLDELYIVPAIRDVIDKYKPSEKDKDIGSETHNSV